MFYILRLFEIFAQVRSADGTACHAAGFFVIGQSASNARGFLHSFFSFTVAAALAGQHVVARTLRLFCFLVRRPVQPSQSRSPPCSEPSSELCDCKCIFVFEVLKPYPNKVLLFFSSLNSLFFLDGACANLRVMASANDTCWTF